MNEVEKVTYKKMDLVKKIFSIKIYLWIVLLIAMLLGLFKVYDMIFGGGRANTSSQSYSVVRYIEKTDEHVFLNVGIQRIIAEKESTKIFNKLEIPYSEKKVLLILNYETKLGIKKPAQIEQMSEKRYKITVPKFEIIGFKLDDKKPYELYDRSGEFLSNLTEEIDTGKITAKALSTKKQKKYLEKYQDDIKESATEYYQSLFKAVDTDVKVEVMFSE